MKKSIFILSALFIAYSTVPVLGQTVSIGARGGISIPKLSTNTDNPVSQGYSSILGADAAAFVNIRFSDYFSLQPMLEFSQQGGQRNGIQAFPASKMVKAFSNIQGLPPGIDIGKILKNQILQGGDYLYIDTESKSKLNYLMVPVLAKFGWNLGSEIGNHFRIFVGAGPYVGYLLSAHQSYSHTKTGLYGSKDKSDVLTFNGTPLSKLIEQLDINFAEKVNGKQDIMSNLHRWNYGISGMVGIGYHFVSGRIFISGGGNYSFNPIQKDSELGQSHTGAATVSLGYTYAL